MVAPQENTVLFAFRAWRRTAETLLPSSPCRRAVLQSWYEVGQLGNQDLNILLCITYGNSVIQSVLCM